MTDMNDLIGRTVEEKVSGFRGVVTGIVYYISGCTQALVAPKMDKDGKVPDSNWWDVQRVVVDESVPKIVLDNGATPGCDAAPPVR